MSGLINNEQICRLMTVEPVHVGVGQDIMGEVDLPVDRESETGVPRFPGTVLKGCYRSHARWWLAMHQQLTGRCPGDSPGEEAAKPDNGHIMDECPICQTFGWPGKGDDDQGGQEGRVFFSDARLAFFPAATDCGTVWFTTLGRAAAYLNLGPELFSGDPYAAARPEFFLGMGTPFAVDSKFSTILVGWIKISDLPTETKEDNNASIIINRLKKNDSPSFPGEALWREIASRTVLLDETTFYRLVETCLERRTCNRINEVTGTVDEGALFSYEALPRHSLLYSRVAWRGDGFPVAGYESPLAVCDLAREGLLRMGLGGLQTRGLGGVLVESLNIKLGVD